MSAWTATFPHSDAQRQNAFGGPHRGNDEKQFPILIEYHPYRKDDVTWSGHDSHWYLAKHSFICVRLDVRGTGGSSGTR